jgi:hypothetical protein
MLIFVQTVLIYDSYCYCCSNGGLINESYEANFLRPLLRETVHTVFTRLFQADVLQYTDLQLETLLRGASILARLW